MAANTTSDSPSATYLHGHSAAPLRSHSWRTVANSCQYLVPYLRRDSRVLDVGCGPGTITVDFAHYVPEGHVTGLEPAEAVLAGARRLAEEAGVADRVTFTSEGNIFKLPYADHSFDVVHVHQVLQHCGRQPEALAEMARVLKPGGVIAARETDYDTFRFYPDHPRFQDTLCHAYETAARHNGGEPNAGRRLLTWAKQAGLQISSCRPSSSSWCFSTQAERDWWGGLWAERVLQGSLHDSIIATGVVTEADLQEVAQGFKTWAACDTGFFHMLHGELIYVKPEN